MKTVKSLLLGSAAGLVAFTGAQAADLPMAEPVEYVRICDTYGSGYFYIPGTETCLRISGYVRAEARIDFNDDPNDTSAPLAGGFDGLGGYEGGDNLGWFARGDIRFDARTETEWGTLRSYIEIWASSNPGTALSTTLDQAFIQFAGFTIGRAQSFYDFLPYNHYGDLFSDEKLEQIAYTASFGSGFAATIAVEDKAERQDNLVGDRASQAWPNVVAALRVDQAWGSAQVSAVVKDNEGNLVGAPAPGSDDIGWAVQAGLSFNLPTASDGSFIWVQGAYGEGAMEYVVRRGSAGDGAVTGQLTDYLEDWMPAGVGTDQTLFGANNTAWAIGGGVNFQASDAVRLALSGMYWEVEHGVFPAFDLEGLKVIGGVYWEPVRQLHFGAEVGYANVEHNLAGGGEIDDLSVTLRAQRSF